MRRSYVAPFLLALGCSDPGSSVSGTIGQAGGTVETSGIALEVPANAVMSEVVISINQTADLAPSDTIAYSPTFQFQPAGLTFQFPVTVRFDFNGAASLATVYWTSGDGTTFDNIGGEVADARIAAQTTHFSRGFVGTPFVAIDAGTGNCNCSPSLSCCGASCVDTTTSTSNCGGCGLACGQGETCNNGVCSGGACKGVGQPCLSTPECCAGYYCGGPSTGPTCMPALP